MQELDPFVFLIVFQEMLGPVLWIMLALAVFGLGGGLYVVLREGRFNSRRLVYSELAGLGGGVLALIMAAHFTVSGFSDAGGPVDWLLVGLIWGLGLAGMTILAYTAQGLFVLHRRE